MKSAIRNWLGGLSLLTLGLLFAGVYVMAVGLSNVAAGVEQSLFTSMAISGALFGLLVASTRLPVRRATVVSGLFGLFFILLRVGGIGPQLLQVVREAALYMGSIASPWFREVSGLVGSEPLQVAWSELQAAFGVVLARSGAWLQTWVAGEPTYDPVAAALLWSGLLWAAAAWAAWGFRARKQPVPALVPAVVLLGIVLGGVRAKPGALIWSLGIVISASVLTAQDVREVRWRSLGLARSRSVRMNLLWWAALLAIGLMAAGALGHEFSYGRLGRTLQGFATGRSDEAGLARQALGLANQGPDESRVRGDLEGLRNAGLPRRHLIGSGPELSEQLVLSIRVIDDPELRGLDANGPTVPYYWRSNTYDVYLGDGWKTSSTESSEYRAGEPSRQEIPVNSRLVAQRIRSVPELGGLLFFAGAVMTVDQPYSVDWRSPND